MPPAIPVTVPPELTVAIEVLLLLHTPPLVASVNVDVCPAQADAVPLIVAGELGTVKSVTAMVTVVDPHELVTV